MFLCLPAKCLKFQVKVACHGRGRGFESPAWFATTAMRLHPLCCPFGEVQQDLLLSCLTIGRRTVSERYRASNWKSVDSSAWMKLFATRSKRKFNNPVSFDEKRALR